MTTTNLNLYPPGQGIAPANNLDSLNTFPVNVDTPYVDPNQGKGGCTSKLLLILILSAILLIALAIILPLAIKDRNNLKKYSSKGRFAEKKERKVIIGAHWKMNKGYNEGIEWIKKAADRVPSRDKVESIVFPQFPLVREAVQNQGDDLRIGVQNVHYEKNGSYTGEVAAPVIAEIGGEYSLVGHSERMRMFNETHEDCNKKVKTLLECGMVPILVVGEDGKEGDDASMKSALQNELDIELDGVSKEDASKVVLSFGPSWSSGTGDTAPTADVEKYCKYIRNDIIKTKYGEDVAKKMRILYSGSVSKDNLFDFLSEEDVDGALIGKNALDLDSFIQLTNIAEEFT